ncbi:winged helix DNA-binding domain-containing protein [Nocardiopsis coralliicola]
MTWRQAIGRRIERHGLGRAFHEGPADAVRAMCGAHAQVQSAGEVSVALRLHEGTRAAVAAALRDGTLIKTYGPRGTVHLLPAADLPMWTGALSALPASASPGRSYVDAAQAAQIRAAVEDALTGAELTADELTAAIAERVGPWAAERTMPAFQGYWPRWRSITHLLAHQGALCFGAPRGRKVTYTSPRRFAESFAPMGGDAALARLLADYLRSYGPATPAMFARWLSAPAGWAAQVFAANSGALEAVDVEGQEAFAVAGDTAPGEPPEGVRLLPYFDAYTVGSHPRSAVFPGPAAERALNRGQAGNFPVLLVDGVAAGVWHQRKSGRRLTVTVEPLRPLGAARRAGLEAQTARLAAAQAATADLAVGTVEVGPHA